MMNYESADATHGGSYMYIGPRKKGNEWNGLREALSQRTIHGEDGRTMMIQLLRRACIVALCLAGAVRAATADTESFDTTAGNLLVVLRESPGANKQDEALRPFGRISARLADGRTIEFDASWYQYLGDLHLRLVFDGARQVQSASPDDLRRLHLSPEAALARAVANLRERYGIPVAAPWSGGLMQVQVRAPELASSYFLDRQFWLEQSRDAPEGLVAAVPGRDGLVFARASDEEALTSLRFSAAALYTASGGTRLSSGLYLFKDGRWTVFQPPQAAPID